ncbi:hypothetical protein GGR32_001371 [Mesonia hippocampi]|uniref:Uncharacterized protein n=1 Tax=Mesonia hippocampi TaxID=1628250 RepID=A0A840EPR3_9FLAO|nr:hypothetical protein [Mesonia hippocampi]MBB4119075.1 hypothetical protein [Mesonia hippocampi]
MRANPSETNPILANRFKHILGKVVFIFSTLFFIMRFIGAFNEMETLPTLILCIPSLLLVVVGFKMYKRQQFMWWYIALGMLIIIGMRYYEHSLYNYFVELFS